MKKLFFLPLCLMLTCLACKAMENQANYQQLNETIKSENINEQQNLTTNQNTAYYGSTENRINIKKLSSLEEALQKKVNLKKVDDQKKLEDEHRTFEATTRENILENYPVELIKQKKGNPFKIFIDTELRKYKEENKLTPVINVDYLTTIYGNNLPFKDFKKELGDLYMPFLTAFWKQEHQENLETEDLNAITNACKQIYLNDEVRQKKAAADKEERIKCLTCCYAFCFPEVFCPFVCLINYFRGVEEFTRKFDDAVETLTKNEN